MSVIGSTLDSVEYDTLADGCGHNDDADALTAMGIEVKECIFFFISGLCVAKLVPGKDPGPQTETDQSN